MPLDQTDKKLINGLIVSVVLFGVVYFWPWDTPFTGYSKQAELLESARGSLTTTAGKYAQTHPALRQVHFGGSGSADTLPPDGELFLLSKLKGRFGEANKVTQQYIDVKQLSNKINFPEWTDIPEGTRNAGEYFRNIYEKHILLVENECKGNGIELDDRRLGFDFSGGLPDENKSKELLRELFIAEKVIDLCKLAKVKEEARERNMNKKPEAYMRIMQVKPEVSETAGPTALVPNPKFDPNEKNPSSPKFKKYIVDKWANFIQEYPVRIQLMCDTNSFIHFLHSIRTIEGQFLVIRQLEILSPALEHSNRDKSEMEPFKLEATSTSNIPKRWPQKEEQIIVTMVAAGMDFFDPKVQPNGFYVAKTGPVRPVRQGGFRMTKTAPSIAPPVGQ